MAAEEGGEGCFEDAFRDASSLGQDRSHESCAVAARVALQEVVERQRVGEPLHLALVERSFHVLARAGSREVEDGARDRCYWDAADGGDLVVGEAGEVELYPRAGPLLPRNGDLEDTPVALADSVGRRRRDGLAPRRRRRRARRPCGGGRG